MHDVIERRATSVVFASVMAVVLAALYYLGRVGFSNPLEPVALALGISLFQVNEVGRHFWPENRVWEAGLVRHISERLPVLAS